jgi:hypothetical protein
VEGEASLTVKIEAPELIKAFHDAQKAIALSGRINTNGPGSTGRSSPDAQAPLDLDNCRRLLHFPRRRELPPVSAAQENTMAYDLPSIKACDQEVYRREFDPEKYDLMARPFLDLAN